MFNVMSRGLLRPSLLNKNVHDFVVTVYGKNYNKIRVQIERPVKKPCVMHPMI